MCHVASATGRALALLQPGTHQYATCTAAETQEHASDPLPCAAEPTEELQRDVLIEVTLIGGAGGTRMLPLSQAYPHDHPDSQVSSRRCLPQASICCAAVCSPTAASASCCPARSPLVLRARQRCFGVSGRCSPQMCTITDCLTD
jgi:hypothetical protein